MKLLSSLIPKSFAQQMIYASGIVSTKVVAIIMLPVFTHYLLPAEYARLDIVQTLANLVSIVVGFGLADTLFRFAGEKTNDEARRQMAAGTFALALIALVIGTAVTQAFAPLISSALPGGITVFQTRVILGSLSVTACILVPLSWLRMQDKAFMFFLASAGWAAVQAASTAFVLYLGYGLDGVLVAGLICAIGLAVVLTLYQLHSSGIRISGDLIRQQGRFGGMLVLAGIAAFTIDGSGRWILAGEAGVLVLAEFALAWKIGIMALLLTEPFSMWWLPRRFLVLSGPDGAERCARITEFAIVLALLAVIGISGAGALGVVTLTPPEYHGAAKYVPALAALAGVKAITSFLTTGVLVEKKTLWPIYIDAGAAVVAVVGNLILIPYFHIWGAIAGFGSAYGVRLVLYYTMGRRVAQIPYRLGRMGLLAFLALATVGACTATSLPLAGLIWGGLGGLILIAVALIGGCIDLRPHLNFQNLADWHSPRSRMTERS